MSNNRGESIKDYNFSKNSFYEKSQQMNNSKFNPFVENNPKKVNYNDYHYLNSTNVDTNSKNNFDIKSNNYSSNYNPYTNNLMKNQLESSNSIKNDVEIEAINMLKAQKEKYKS